MEIKEVLIGARKLIEREQDWGAKCKKGGVHCMQTAIEKVAGRRCDGPACEVISRVIGIPYARAHDIWEWNDAPGRTHAEVLAAFDKAIAAA